MHFNHYMSYLEEKGKNKVCERWSLLWGEGNIECSIFINSAI